MAELGHQSSSPSSDRADRQKTFGTLRRRPTQAARVLAMKPAPHANHRHDFYDATTRNLPLAASKRKLARLRKKSVAGLRNPVSKHNPRCRSGYRASSLIPTGGFRRVRLRPCRFCGCVCPVFRARRVPAHPSRWAVLPNSRRGENMVPPDQSVLTFNGHRAVRLPPSSRCAMVCPRNGGAQ